MKKKKNLTNLLNNIGATVLKQFVLLHFINHISAYTTESELCDVNEHFCSFMENIFI